MTNFLDQNPTLEPKTPTDEVSKVINNAEIMFREEQKAKEEGERFDPFHNLDDELDLKAEIENQNSSSLWQKIINFFS